MLEPGKPSRGARRRRPMSQDPRRPQPPIPLRSNQNNGKRVPPATNFKQSHRQGTPNPQTDAGRSPQNRRMVRRGESPPPDQTRFDLRHLLSNESSASPNHSSRAELPPRLNPSGKRSPADGSGQLQMPPGAIARSASSQVVPLHRGTPRGVNQLDLPGERRSQNGATQARPGRPLPSTFAPPARPRKALSRRVRRPASPLLHLTRLVILGVGIAAIAGTIMSVWNPSSRTSSQMAQAQDTAIAGDRTDQPFMSRDLSPGNRVPLASSLRPGQELTTLSTSVQTLAAQNPGLSPGVHLIDLDNGGFINLNGSKLFSAASTIKVPILVAFLQDVDAGKIRLDEVLSMEPQDVGGGSGNMQDTPLGTQYTVLYTAIEMIQESDNTATNMIIRRLGGAEVLNRRFQEWGLTSTVIHNLLPDLTGTNTTTPEELSNLLAMVSQGDLLSLRSRDRLLEIMRGTRTDTLLPQGLSEGALIAHKTGSIAQLVGDTGIVDMPNGKRYIVTVMVQRPANDTRAQELIRQISQTIYQYLNQSSLPNAEAGQTSPTSPNPGLAQPDGSSSNLPSLMEPTAPGSPSVAPF